jgi:hypothetical protein
MWTDLRKGGVALMKRQKARQGAILVALLATAVLCGAPTRRKELHSVDGSVQKPTAAAHGQKVLRSEAGKLRGGQVDLMGLLAGPRGARVFAPGSRGIFDPGGWGVFGPGGWGLQSEQSTNSSGRLTGKRQATGMRGSREGLQGRHPMDSETEVIEARAKQSQGEGIFDPGGWGILPLMANAKADVSVRGSGRTVLVRVAGSDEHAVQRIRRLLRPGTEGVWLDVDRTGPETRREQKSVPRQRQAQDRRGRSGREHVSGSGQGEQVPTEDVGHGVSPDVIDPIVIESTPDGIAIHLEWPHRGAEQLQADIELQVEGVRKLSQAFGAALNLQHLLHSGGVRTRWERHPKGAALVFLGPSELQQVGITLQAFGDYLDGKGDDIVAARRRTAFYFSPSGQKMSTRLEKPEQEGGSRSRKAEKPSRPGNRKR